MMLRRNIPIPPISLIGIVITGVLFIASAPVRAQGTVAASETPPPTLAAALGSVIPPPGVVIAVNAEKTTLPYGTALPGRDASIETISAAFQRLARPFGSVTAVAPPTMVVLNTHPSGENIFSGMRPEQVFKLLLAGLDDAGWKALTSEKGLGMDHLATPEQQAMFMALFPGGSLNPISTDGGDDPTKPRAAALLSGSQLSRSRLRLSQQAHMMLPTAGDSGPAGDGPLNKPGGGGHYAVGFRGSPSDPAGSIGGVPVRLDVPNFPRPGQLNLKDARFRALISLRGIKTVADLVERIGRQTHTELYADTRLERLSFLAVGQSSSAPASDLLRAAAFCVTGTYRNVGPAFVLTDDVLGIATRQEILRRFTEKVSAARSAAEHSAEKDLAQLPSHLASLPFNSDSLTIPPSEMQFQKKTPNQISNALFMLQVPFDALPSEQQDLARTLYQKIQADEARQVATPYYQEHPDEAARITHVSLQGPITIYSQPTLLLDVPGLDGSVDLGAYVGASNLGLLGTGIGGAIGGGLTTATVQSGPYKPPKAPPAGPAAVPLLAQFRRRACVAAPQSLTELDSLLDEMPHAGLNELWLKVPPPESSTGKGKPAAAALVAEALAHAHGVAVLPVIDVLAWGPDAPAADVDYTVNGENSLQWPWYPMVISDGTDLFSLRDDPPPHLFVSPFAPGVAPAITALQQQVIRKGIAGVVWSTIAPYGYEPGKDAPASETTSTTYYLQGRQIFSPDDARGAFGYHLQARLSFLRSEHVDPVDIEIGQEYYTGSYLPYFSDDTLNGRLRTQWAAFRRRGDLALLQRLYQSFFMAAVPPNTGLSDPDSAPVLPLMLDLPGEFPMYVEWDDRRALPFVPRVSTIEALAAALRTQTRHAMLPISHRDWTHPRTMVSELRRWNPPGPGVWDGVVLNFAPTLPDGAVPARSSLENLRQFAAVLQSNE